MVTSSHLHKFIKISIVQSFKYKNTKHKYPKIIFNITVMLRTLFVNPGYTLYVHCRYVCMYARVLYFAGTLFCVTLFSVDNCRALVIVIGVGQLSETKLWRYLFTWDKGLQFLVMMSLRLERQSNTHVKLLQKIIYLNLDRHVT